MDNRNTGKPLRLSSGRFDLPDDLVLLCIPEWFRAALLDLTGRMLWSRVWTAEDGNDYDLTESDRQRIEYGIYKLAQEECDMEIINNINVTCGGCSSGGLPTTIYCYLQDGTPVITPQPPAPTEPVIPNDGTPLPLDPEVDSPPEGYEDWEEFDTVACLVANALWYFALFLVRWAETLIDILALLATLVTLLTPLLPAAVIAAIGGVALLDIIWQLVQILTAEQASDILNEIADWLVDERQKIVCYIYESRHNYVAETSYQLGQWATSWIDIYGAVTMTPDDRNKVQNFIAKIFFFSVFWGYVMQKVTSDLGVADEYEPLDCGTCAGGGASGLYFWNYTGAMTENGAVFDPATQQVTFGATYTLESQSVPIPGSDPEHASLFVGESLAIPVSVDLEILSVANYTIAPAGWTGTGSNGAYKQIFNGPTSPAGFVWGLPHDGHTIQPARLRAVGMGILSYVTTAGHFTVTFKVRS